MHSFRLAVARWFCPARYEVVAIPFHRLSPAQQEAELAEGERRLAELEADDERPILMPWSI